MVNYGNLNFDDEWYDKPIEKYLSHKRDHEKITEGRLDDIREAVLESPEEPEWDAWDEFVNWHDGMTTSDAQAFKQQLEKANLGPRTVEKKMKIVKSFLNYLLEREVVDSNPVAYVHDETDYDYPDSDYIDRTIEEVGAYLRGIKNIQQRAIGVLFAKSGMRRGEMYNIDLPFLHLDHDIYDTVLDQHNITLVNEIADQPDALYIPSDPTERRSFRGEFRYTGNKRKQGTKIPIDNETKKALLDWLAVRPETTQPHPLWTSPTGSSDRIGATNTNQKLTNYWAEKTGFVDDGSNGAFMPHWFRHFFTTNMKPGRGHHDDSIDPTLVKYIRGDVEDDIMDVYTHDWGNQVRGKYLNHIYYFGIYD